MLFNCADQVVNLSGLMLDMVQLHGFGVDVRLKRSIVVGKWWQFVSQNILLEFVPDSGVLRLGKPTAGKSVWRNGCASLPSPILRLQRMGCKSGRPRFGECAPLPVEPPTLW